MKDMIVAFFIVFSLAFVSNGGEPIVAKAGQPDSKDDRSQQLADLASAASMMYVRGGTIQNCAPKVCNNAKQIAKETIQDEKLSAARDSFLRVSAQYEKGLEFLSGKNVQPGDPREVRDAFLAGLFDDDDLFAKTVGNISRRLGEIEKHQEIGSKRIADAALQHERFWRQDLLPLIKEVSGPDAGQLPVNVSAVRGATTGNSGIAVKNSTNQPLHNLCIAVRSTIGFDGVQNSVHYVFVKKLDAYQEIMLSWRLAGGLIQPDSNPKIGDGITFSMWSTESTITNQDLKLPKDISAVRKTKKSKGRVEWVPFRLKLTAN